jgi:hypothetical protein
MSYRRRQSGWWAVLAALLTLAVSAPAFAQANGYTYDIQANGIPKFVNTVYIDLAKVTRISKFRSGAGHDYSDSTQFGRDGYKNPPDGSIEACASMKHYFIAPDATTQIYAPVTGRVTRMFDEPIGGTQIQITSDEQPAFTFTMFHVELNASFVEGDHVEAGQNIGHHTGTQTWSDMAVFVRTPRGNHLISYFDTLTDEAFAAFQARGVQSREQLQLSREYRRANLVFSCAGTAKIVPDSEYVNLTGGPTSQTISISGITNFSLVKLGDPPARVTATASSGLAVTATARYPKVCAYADGAISWRRAGTCVVAFTQGGDRGTLAAQPVELTLTVAADPAAPARLPGIGGIRPSFTGTTESYLLFHNQSSVPGAVTVALYNGATGEKVAAWVSPTIPAHASRQFQIDDLERAAVQPFVKPAAWGIRIESATMGGYFQHILFDRAAGAITNASSCDAGVTGVPYVLPYAYTSLFADFPSTIVFTNATSSGAFLGASLNAADTGAQVGLGGYYPSGPFNTAPAARTATALTMSELQARLNFTPTPETSRVAVQGSDTRLVGAYLQHVLESRRTGVLSDMNTACSLGGYVMRTVPSPLFTGRAYSGSNVSARSSVRFYNDSKTAAPVTVALRDPATGNAVAEWSSPDIAPGAMLDVPVSTIETETATARKDIYNVTVETPIDGFFQLLTQAGGAISNFSTCPASTTVNGSLLLGVHSTARASAGYASSIVVNNTGRDPARADIDVYDPRDGRKLATYTTATIPANGQLTFDPGAIEARLTMLAGTGPDTYVLKLDPAFTGFLQHFMMNHEPGVITDLTAMCEM